MLELSGVKFGRLTALRPNKKRSGGSVNVIVVILRLYLQETYILELLSPVDASIKNE